MNYKSFTVYSLKSNEKKKRYVIYTDFYVYVSCIKKCCNICYVKHVITQ